MTKATEKNTVVFYLHKSGRKNAKTSDCILINHLISHGRNIPDERIINQIVNTFEKAVYECKQFNHIEISATASIFKTSMYKNVYGEKHKSIDTSIYRFERCKLYSIEQLLNKIFSFYCLVYPYNTIHLESLHSNASIRSIINTWYKIKKEGNTMKYRMINEKTYRKTANIYIRRITGTKNILIYREGKQWTAIYQSWSKHGEFVNDTKKITVLAKVSARTLSEASKLIELEAIT